MCELNAAASVITVYERVPEIIKEYQMLIAGILALTGTLLTFMAAWKSLNYQKRRAYRENEVARMITLTSSYFEISSLRDGVGLINSYIENIDENESPAALREIISKINALSVPGIFVFDPQRLSPLLLEEVILVSNCRVQLVLLRQKAKSAEARRAFVRPANQPFLPEIFDDHDPLMDTLDELGEHAADLFSHLVKLEDLIKSAMARREVKKNDESINERQ